MTLVDKLKESKIKPPVNPGYEKSSYSKRGRYNRDMEDYFKFAFILGGEIDEKGAVPVIDIVNAFRELGMIELKNNGYDVRNTYCNKVKNPYLKEFEIKTTQIIGAARLFTERQIGDLGIPTAARVSCKDDSYDFGANRSLYYKDEKGLFNYLRERLLPKKRETIVSYDFFYNPLNKNSKK